MVEGTHWTIDSSASIPHPHPGCAHPIQLPLPAHGGDPAVLIHCLFIQKIREMIKGFQRKPRAWGEDEWELIQLLS